MSDVIKFEFDQPVEVALRYAEPRVFPPSDRFPGAEERHMFSTTDGRVMYVTPLTSARIKALHLAQGECFFVCKRKNGRLTEYAVTREPMASRPVATNGFSHKKALPPVKSNLPERLYYSPNDLPGEPEEPSELENKLADSIALVERRKQAQSAPVAAPNQQPEWSRHLVAQSIALCDAYAEVMRHASRHDNIRGEDVRSLFLSAFINISKSGNGGRNAA